MKIKRVVANNRKHAFDITVRGGRTLSFPYSQLTLKPNANNKISAVFIDKEIGEEGFTYKLKSGEEDTIHIDHILHYLREPEYALNLLRHDLSVLAQKCVSRHPVKKKELIRRLGTSSSQLDRLIDPTNNTSTLDSIIKLLLACDKDVGFAIDGESVSLYSKIHNKREAQC